jgi:hypothetical protein
MLFTELTPVGRPVEQTPPAPAPKRPYAYSEEVGFAILGRISRGEKLFQVCAARDMPYEQTFFRWVAEDKGFAEAYRCALEARFDRMEHELIKIADDAANDYITEYSEDGIPSIKPNKELLERTAMRIKTRQWVMAKALPRKYADKPSVAVIEAAALNAPKEEPHLYLARDALEAIRAQRVLEPS